ncbi:MAG: transporter substrate-binding domain-containing protein [Desulforhopalus sp.]|nr:transporter substrate-binding domain-containing protein [Desulforhopalus sp.]
MKLPGYSRTSLADRNSTASSPGVRLFLTVQLFVATLVLMLSMANTAAWCRDLDEVIKAGKLRHLGIVYANFVTKDKTGLDVELMQLFAEHLGVKYEFVETTWANVLPDLLGNTVKPQGDDVAIGKETPIKGDVIATGFTELNWRKKIVNYSEMTFPTGVWLIAQADSKLQPIVPSGDLNKDIEMVKEKLNEVSVLGLRDSCLDPSLYQLEKTGARIQLFPIDRDLSEMIPTVMARAAETTLMDMPVALLALEQWPGKIKVVGPVSESQAMACAFPKSSPKLLAAFNTFFTKIKGEGTYKQLVEKYYPSLFVYYPDPF